MCLGLPLTIVEINEKNAVGEMNGVRRNIRIDLVPDVKIGDYVMVHAGFAIEKISEKDALETIDAVMQVEEVIGREGL